MLKHLLMIGALMAALPATAHEFWIEPEAFEIAPGAPVVADLLVGDKLEGAKFGFVPPNFTRFDIVLGDEVIPVEGRPGDRPALNMPVEGAGLATIVHVTRPYRLTYKDWATFLRFLDHKDLDWAAERHLARGFTEDKVNERYTRFAKSLVALGDGAGTDREVGLETEIVAEANPYTDDLAEGFPVRVLYAGEPRVNVQVELFDRAPDGTVSQRYFRTDAEGRAVLDVETGHFYLVDAVVLREAEGDYPWESLWASMTFTVPK
jgi:hypothetical protein